MMSSLVRANRCRFLSEIELIVAFLLDLVDAVESYGFCGWVLRTYSGNRILFLSPEDLILDPELAQGPLNLIATVIKI